MLQDAQIGRLYLFTDYHNHLLFSDLTAFNRNRFNNNRANWLIDYNTKTPHHSLSLRSPIQYLIHQQPECHSVDLYSGYQTP